MLLKIQKCNRLTSVIIRSNLKITNYKYSNNTIMKKDPLGGFGPNLWDTGTMTLSSYPWNDTPVESTITL